MSYKLHLVAIGCAAVFGLGAAGAVAASSGGVHAPLARVAAGCNVGTGQGYGYSYLTSLKVRNTTCATGKKLARHHGHLRGWRCHKKVTARSPVQYDATMTCTSGRRRVVYTFTQNT